MKFDTPAEINPVDQLKVVGHPTPRIDGPHKVTGQARFAYEHRDEVPDPAYGWVVGATIAKGRIESIELDAATAAPGVLAIVTAKNAGPLKKARRNTAHLLAGPEIEHYHQAVALVVAETLEQARAAAELLDIRYSTADGKYDLAQERQTDSEQIPPSPKDGDDPHTHRFGDFEGAFKQAQVQLDATYTTPDQSHMMIEPHATLARWDGDRLTLWTSNQMIDWGRTDIATTLGMPKDHVRMISHFVGGGFGGKLWLRADALLAALGARATGRAVKVALHRPLIANNTVHRPATIQRLRLGTDAEGRISAIAHEATCGNLPGGEVETSVDQTRLLYAGANRLTSTRLVRLDLPEGNAMRAPGEASGMMALESAMDEMAEKLGIDPIELRVRNDTWTHPEEPDKAFSQRQLIDCLRRGAEQFGWNRRNATPAQKREGEWLIGMGVAAAFRNNLTMNSAARVTLNDTGAIIVETDMTDIGTGSYTIIAQTAAEVMGVALNRVAVRLGDSDFPVSAGSGGQWGGNSATAGVYAACMKLRDMVLEKLGISLNVDARFSDGMVHVRDEQFPLESAAADKPLVAEDLIEFGALGKKFQQSTFGAHFVEVAVNVVTGEPRVRRMLAVCASGRILNPMSARSQVIGAMTMGVGSALTEALSVDAARGYFVNHDLAGYEVPVHADIPDQEVIFLDDPDPLSSPMKAKGIAELGICGVAAAVANAVYNATGIRVRDFPITVDKLLPHLPEV